MLKVFDKYLKQFGRFVKYNFLIIVSESINDYVIRREYFKFKKKMDFHMNNWEKKQM